MSTWIVEHEGLLTALGLLSLLTFIIGIVLIVVLVLHLPADYFSRPTRRTGAWKARHPALRITLLLAKNLFGTLLLGAGLLMLLLPGQGLLTILVGLTLVDFPGKYRIERWLVQRQSVLRGVNWLRRRAGVPPLDTAGRDQSDG